MDNNLRIRVSSSSHPIYKVLCEKRRIFSTMSELFFWCAILGYKNNLNRTSLGSGAKGVFNWGVFDDDIQKPILKMIAVEAKDDFGILNSNDNDLLIEFRDIIEEFAESGLSQLLLSFDEKTINHETLFSIIVDEIKDLKPSG